MTNPSFGILGTGKYFPSQPIKNSEIEKKCGLPLGEIYKKTGIKSRFIATENETASHLSAAASKMALQSANVQPEDLDALIACTFTADYVIPALACKIHQILGAKNAFAFDVMANCTGFQVGLNVCDDMLRADPTKKYGLVVGAALQSPFINWHDSSSCMYFGDGFGAAVIGQVPENFGFLSHHIFTNSSVYDSVRIRGGGSSYPLREHNINDALNYYEINGLDVWKQVISNQPIAINSALKKAGYDISDVDFFIFHQANAHLIEYLMGKLKIELSKTYINIDKYGNTAEASMAIALCEAVEQNKIKHGDLVVISGVGAGFTFGASVMRWWNPLEK